MLIYTEIPLNQVIKIPELCKSYRNDMSLLWKKPKQAPTQITSQTILVVMENITPPGTSGAVRKPGNRDRNGA